MPTSHSKHPRAAFLFSPPPKKATETKDGGQANQNLRTTLVSKNITVNGHRTSVRLEPKMWEAFDSICHRERFNRHELCSEIAARMIPHQSLTSAIRLFVTMYFYHAATEEGHLAAGHKSRYRVG